MALGRLDGRLRGAVHPLGRCRGRLGGGRPGPQLPQPDPPVPARQLGAARGGCAHRGGRLLAQPESRNCARRGLMKATQQLHEMGQSLWLDNITRGLLTSGTLRRYIQEFSVTGLTSNPTIFDHAMKNSHAYDDGIRQKLKQGKSGEALFFELAIEDLTGAADLFRPIHEATNRVDGWVSLEVSPKLAYDTKRTIAAAQELHT